MTHNGRTINSTATHRAREASAGAVVAGGAGGGEPAPELDESKPTTTLQVKLELGVVLVDGWGCGGWAPAWSGLGMADGRGGGWWGWMALA